MMILAFFGDNHQIQSQVVHYLDQTIKGFVIDHIDNDSKRLSVEQKIEVCSDWLPAVTDVTP